MRSCLGRASAPQSTAEGAAGDECAPTRSLTSASVSCGQTGHAWGLVPGSPGLHWAWPPLGVDKTRPLGAPIPVKGDQQHLSDAGYSAANRSVFPRRAEP